MDCAHTWTRTEAGKTGSWCTDCGVKVYDVDPRECKDCAHHERLIGGSICRKHLMGVTQDMHVTFKIAEGSCWTQRTSAPATA